MTHFIDKIAPDAFIFGNKLKGERKKELRPRLGFIPIIDFKCEIEQIADDKKRRNAIEKYKSYGYELHGNNDDVLSGERGILEPEKGCDTPGFLTKGSPKKGSHHNPTFTVCCVKDCPAVCYFDGWNTQMALQKKIQSKVQKK